MDPRTFVRRTGHHPSQPQGMLKEGQQAPSFTAQTDSGDSLSLDKLRGQRVVLYFYPKDDTPG